MQTRVQFFETELKMATGMVCLPIRCTQILTTKGSILISPIDFTSEQLKTIAAAGPVLDIVAPSLLHHLFVKAAAAHFPNAVLWGPAGCRDKRPDISWQKTLGEVTWPYSDEIEALPLLGMPKVNEVVFFDKISKTLILTDLCFNLQHPKGWASPLVLRLMGTYRKFAVSRFFKKFVQDLPSFHSSVQQLLLRDIDRVVMAHGETIEFEAKERFKSALQEQGFL